MPINSEIKINEAYLYMGKKQIATAKTNFTICDCPSIEMTKTVDRKDECYFSGDIITFTIKIKNTGNTNLSGLYFKDTLDSIIVPTTGTDYTVTTTSGVITQKDNPIVITSIQIAPNETVTITISGKVT